MIDILVDRFRQVMPKVDFCSLRYVRELDEIVSVRQDVPHPMHRSEDAGAMITVMHQGSMGYAATSDLSEAGLKLAVQRAQAWASATAGRSVVDYRKVPLPKASGQYAGPQRIPWSSTSLADKFDLLLGLSRRLKVSDRIVDWDVSLWHSDIETILLTSSGARIHQRAAYLAPEMGATANEKALSQHRTFGGARGHCRQGGLEVLDEIGFSDAPEQVANEALELLAAPNCPSGKMDVLLTCDQMILQVHESIGHPLEIDRILGDERNYAGTSFVTPEMFGSYRYGSDLLNVTFDPTCTGELAAYAFDDDGTPAAKVYLIEKGILRRGLGGATSQMRSGLAGTANARASGWNRPPIDRMADLNLQCGSSTMDQMIAAIDHGVLMKTNCSWSIDDSRNKFQFGCEWGRLIEKGKLTTVVRNPNYRGISATFWRNLKMVGNQSTMSLMGSPFCGKGEPNQMVKVGHACPACVFADVEVFGGA